MAYRPAILPRPGGPVPAGYGRGTIADIIMAGGHAAADAHLRGGAILSDAVMGAGQVASTALQEHAKAREMGKRDAAWVAYVQGGDWMKDPRSGYAEAVRIWGPDAGPRQFQGLAAVAQLGQEKRDPVADRKALGQLGTAMGGMGDAARAAVWPQAVALAKGAFPELELPGEYDPKMWAEVVAPMVGQLAAGGEGFTLKPGEARYDAQGKQVAAAPAAAAAPEPRVVGRSLVMPDGKVIYRDPEAPRAGGDAEPLMSVMGDDGQPVYMPRSQAVGRRPASSREQGRPVSSVDANRIADFDTSLDDLRELGQQLKGNQATGAGAQLGAMLPNVVTEVTGLGSDAKQRQATIDRVKQVIGKALEGGVLRAEDERKYAAILPTIGDPPAVAAAKLAGLQRAIELRRQTTLQALADADYDTSKYESRGAVSAPATPGDIVTVRTPEEARRLAPGTQFRTPDGRVKVR